MTWFESHLSSGGGASHNYSTTEQIVGTWIDGSILYEKSYTFTSPSNNTSTNLIDISDLTVADIVYLNGYIKRLDATTFYSDGFTMWIRFKNNPSSGNKDYITMKVTNADYYSQSGVLVIRYTKSST